jgi:hypothetical protein
MSISDNYVPDVSTGNSVTVAFSGSWNVIAEDYFVCQLKNIATGALTTLDVPGSDGTLAFTSSGYTATLNVAPSSAYQIVRSRNITKDQNTPYKTSLGFQGLVEENSFDKVTAITQDLQEQVNRTLLFPIGTTATGVLPVPLDGYGLIWDGTGGTLRNTTTSLATLETQAAALYAIRTDITTVSGISSSVTAVAGNAANINTVAGISGSVSTVAGISGSVSTVAGISANVTTVAGIQGNVTTVAGIASSVSTVAGISANVTSVAGNATNINTVATNIANVNLTGGSIANVNSVASDLTNINNVASDLTNINNVAADLTNINLVAADLTNIDAVKNNTTNINTVAGISANVTTVAGISGNVTTVAGISANVTTVAGISANVTTVATNATSVNTVATNIASVINAANNIPKASLNASVAPTVNNDNTQGYSAGSIWCDTTHNLAYLCTNAATGAAVWNSAFATSALSGLSDVTISGVANNDILMYSTGSSKWVNHTLATFAAPAGQLSGATLNATVLASSLTSTGTLTGGATGAGFTVALGTSTITGILGSANGGTGNGFTKFSGATTSEKTYTLPNASATILTDNAAVTSAQGGTGFTTYTKGDLIIASATNTLSKLAVGSGTQVLGVSGGAPAWVAAASGGGGARALSGTDTVVASDNGKLLTVSGTCALALTAAATVGSFTCFVKNTATSGVQIITITPNGAENLDGSNTVLRMLPGEMRSLSCDATAWTTAVIEPFKLYITASTNFTTAKNGYVGITGQAWGGGGSGGAGATNGGGGGGGGGYYAFEFFTGINLNVNGMTFSATIGAGGLSQTSANTAGNAGGQTTLQDTGSGYLLAQVFGGGAGGGSSLGAGGGGGSTGYGWTAGGGAGVTTSGVGGNAVTTTAGTGGPCWDQHTGTAAGTTATSANGGGGGGNSSNNNGSAFNGGGGGGAAAATTGFAGSPTVNGGAGGGGASNITAGAGGTSVNGGRGGAGAASGTATSGEVGGGGGGGVVGTGGSGAGGGGRLIIVGVC